LSHIESIGPLPSRAVFIAEGGTAACGFQEGEIVTGKVIARLEGGRFILRCKGLDLVAETCIPIPCHGEARFRVDATFPRTVLQLLPEAPDGNSALACLRKLFPLDVSGKDLAQTMAALSKAQTGASSSELREALGDLVRFFQATSAEGLAHPDVLAGAVSRSGLFLEHRLKAKAEGLLKEAAAFPVDGDLKGILLRLKSRWDASLELKDQPDDTFLKPLGKGIDQLLRKVELFQVLNLCRPETPERMFLFLPFWLGDQPQFMEMSVQLPRGGSDPDHGPQWSVLLLLELPQLGLLNIHVALNGRNLSCSIRVTDPEISRSMEPFVSDLKARLDRLGFVSLVNVSAASSSEMSASLTPSVREEWESLLSVVV
jgi:hypothetical protein